jgi:ABC-type branched-subunit amino acid transport system substrate-binding protein
VDNDRVRRPLNLISAVVCCVFLLGGCSSQVPPEEFVRDGFLPAAGAEESNNTTGATTAANGDVIGAPSQGAGNGGGSGGSTGGAGGGSGGDPGGGGASGASNPGIGVTPGSCAGFRNGPGINNSTITLANASDLSGPVPGLFTSAQQAAKAYIAYFNATSRVCGRKLKLIGYDSQTSSFGDQEAATSACSSSFAMVGSMGAFDSGGAKTVTDCGIPDLRTLATTPERIKSPVTFGTDSVNTPQVSTIQYQYLKTHMGDAYTKSALLYLDAGAAVPNALAYKKTMQTLGYKFLYTQGIDVAALNYAPYATRMKSLGVKLVQFEGAYQYAVRLKKAMQDQGLNAVFVMDSIAYDPSFVGAGASIIDGMWSYVDTALFEEASRNSELQLYLKWLHQVAPGARPSFFGMYAWGAAKLFAQTAVRLGGQLSRSSFIAALRGTHGYTANGLFAPQDVGGKHTTGCQTMIQLQGGKWVRRTPYPWSCSTVYDTSR